MQPRPNHAPAPSLSRARTGRPGELPDRVLRQDGNTAERSTNVAARDPKRPRCRRRHRCRGLLLTASRRPPRSPRCRRLLSSSGGSRRVLRFGDIRAVRRRRCGRSQRHGRARAAPARPDERNGSRGLARLGGHWELRGTGCRRSTSGFSGMSSVLPMRDQTAVARPLHQ
jgi:hypothetical protein